MKYISLPLCMAIVCSLLTHLHAEVKQAAPGGFQIAISRTVECTPSEAYDLLTKKIAQWWDAEHSYSGKAENFSMDFEKGCLLEQLPDKGYVRHLEIVFHQPGKALRLTGGLGPLQGMGVNGAMSFQFTSKAGKKTEVRMLYFVSGFDGLKLDRIAPAVNQVLEGQLDRLQSFADQES